VRAVSDAPSVVPRMPLAAPLQMPMPAPSPQPQPQAAAPAPKRMPPANHTPIDPDLPPDQPLEPGSGPPRQRAGARIAASEAALGSSRPAPQAGGKSSFIAAARRAAQTAVHEASARLPGAAEAVVETDDNGQPSLRGKMMKRVKSLFIAASIVAVVVGTVQILGNVLSSNLQAPQVKSAKTSDADTTTNNTDMAPALAAANAPAMAPAVSPAGGNIATALPPLDLNQSAQSMPSLFNPPALNPPAAVPAPKNDITGSIGKPTANGKPVREVPVSAPATGGLPIAIGGTRLRNAAVAGDAAAAYEVAARFQEGRGVPVNLEEAARWYERAGSKGLAPAQFRYASMLEKGQGVKKDLSSARRLYLAAAAKGNAKAMHNLAVLYAEGIEGRPDYTTAAQWFQKAAHHGVADSEYNLGVLAARGLGTEKNLGDSYKWFALAAVQGDKEAARKRDEVASQLDAKALAAAQYAVKTFVPATPPQDATVVPVPSGGWDDTASAPSAPSAHSKTRPAGPMSIGAYNIGKR
jgi:localization factor PodJL